MKTYLEIQRQSGIDRRKIRPDGAVGIADGECPGCGASPFLVRGGNLRRDVGSHDRYQADGHSVCCGDPVGYLYAEVDTIFGAEEDERVLHGRARVY